MPQILNVKGELQLADEDLLPEPTGRAVQQKIAAYRREAYAKGYQNGLFGPQAEVETRLADGFAFDQRPYPAAWHYQGSYRFQKHFFGAVGELNAKGEEFECARFIDTLPQVRHWIRNLATRPQTSFWLPTSTDRFYPDFVAELQDGRVLVIEYKGEHLADTSSDTQEKRNIGQLWAKKSSEKGLFLTAEKRDARGRDTRGQVVAAVQPGHCGY